jgi:hypothetical protein
VIAFGAILVLLLHFSIAVSRLADQSKVLAQRIALLEERQREGERAKAAQTQEPQAAPEKAAEAGEPQRPRQVVTRVGD